MMCLQQCTQRYISSCIHILRMIQEMPASVNNTKYSAERPLASLCSSPLPRGGLTTGEWTGAQATFGRLWSAVQSYI